MRRLITHPALVRLLRLTAVIACTYCLLIPAAPLNKYLSEDARTGESEKEESSEKANTSAEEFGVPRIREDRLTRVCDLAAPHQKSSTCVSAVPVAAASSHRTSTHADRDLRNGIGSPLLT